MLLGKKRPYPFSSAPDNIHDSDLDGENSASASKIKWTAPYKEQLLDTMLSMPLKSILKLTIRRTEEVARSNEDK